MSTFNIKQHGQELSEFVAGLKLPSLPGAVLRQAKLCLVDGIGASLHSANDKTVGIALKALCGSQSAGPATAIGLKRGLSSESAAFINSVSAAATLRTDVFVESATHPGIVVLPATIAVAEEQGIGGGDLLCAIVAGYEVTARLGQVIITPDLAKIFRPTGIVGATAAAAAVSRLLGFDAATTNTAMCLAANTASGLNEWANHGSNEHLFHSAFAARNAIVAAKLAQAGASAAPNTIHGSSGLLAAYGGHRGSGELTDNLGVHYSILDVKFKPAPACAFAQAPCLAALSIVESEGVQNTEIAAVDITVSRAAREFPGCDNAGPWETQPAAQQSIQFAVASALVAGAIQDELWSPPFDPRVTALAQKCRLHVSTDKVGWDGAKVSVLLRNGQVLSAHISNSPTLDEDEILARFTRDATVRLGNMSATAALESLMSIERESSVTQLIGRLTQAA